MKWTKQRIASVGVLAAAAAAFVIDRGLLSASDAAGAATPVVDVSTSARGAMTVTAAPSTAAANAAQPLAVLARQLDAVSDAQGVPSGVCADAFRAPPEWFGQVSVAASAVQPMADNAVAFRADHKLTAVLRNGNRADRSIAVIRGQAVRMGQSIGGFTLNAIHDDWVQLSDGNGAWVRLDLPKPNLSSASVR